MIARIHQERLARLENHPAVADTRSIGTVAAVELEAADAGYSSKFRSMLYQFYLDAGVLLRPLGHIIYILPPFAISPTDLHYVHDRIVDSLALVEDR
jgi:adenosylmethionine---8-amino-7-oxononanoate aminotransferase